MHSPHGCGSSERTRKRPQKYLCGCFQLFLRAQHKLRRPRSRHGWRILQFSGSLAEEIPVNRAQLPPRSSRTLRPSANGSFGFKSDVSRAQKLRSDWSGPLRERHPAEAGPRPLHRRHGNGRKHRVPSLRNKREKLSVCWRINTFSPVIIHFLASKWTHALK